MPLYAGLDWASAEHAVCVIDECGTIVKRLVVEHTAKGLSELRRALRAVSPGEPVPVAIERPSGLVVDTLVDAGHPVVPIHPNVVKASRPRYGSAGAKSDPGDAYLLADLLRTDGHRFRVLAPASDEVRALRAKVRLRDDLVATRVQLANQLRNLLESFWPGAVEIFADIDSLIALSFLESFPTPGAAAKLTEKRLTAFLKAKSYSGHRKSAELLARLGGAPVGLAGEKEAVAKGALVGGLVRVLEPLVREIAKLTSAIEHDVAAMPVGRVVMSFPYAGGVNAAQIVAELGDDPSRFTSADHLATEAGVSPVTRASGKHIAVGCRFACNKRLRRALTCWADNSRRGSKWAADIYRRAVARGCDHPHAVRILARAWVRVLWRCWHDHLDYDAGHHKGALTLTALAA